MITNKKTAFLLQKTPLLQSNFKRFQAVLTGFHRIEPLANA